MAYTLALEGLEPSIDLEFDRLYAQGLSGEWSPVRDRCQQLLATPNPPAWTHLLLGYAELSEKDFESAHSHFCEGMSLPEPLGSESCAGVGRALLGLSRHDEALRLLQEVVARWPESHFVWHALGETFAVLGDNEHAWLCALQAAALCPTHADSLSLLVAAASQLARHAELIKALEDIRNAQPWNLDVRGTCALTLLRNGRHVEAVEEMTRVVSFAPFAPVSPAVLEMIRDSISTAQTRGT